MAIRKMEAPIVTSIFLFLPLLTSEGWAGKYRLAGLYDPEYFNFGNSMARQHGCVRRSTPPRNIAARLGDRLARASPEVRIRRWGKEALNSIFLTSL